MPQRRTLPRTYKVWSQLLFLRRLPLPLQLAILESAVLICAQEQFKMNYLNRAFTDVKTDHTWNNAIRLTKKGARAAPAASVRYAEDKFPIIGWLPRYDWRWLVNDCIAGLTIGLMLIPQALSYAKIAKIPVEYGLMSSWFPPLLYAFMGTTKGMIIP